MTELELLQSAFSAQRMSKYLYNTQGGEVK